VILFNTTDTDNSNVESYRMI